MLIMYLISFKSTDQFSLVFLIFFIVFLNYMGTFIVYIFY